MNRNKRGVMPEITRETYKGVKKFDRQQFTSFCTDLYRYGYEDGYEAGQNNTPGIDAEEIYKVIADIKGIGPARLKAIKAAIDAAFGGKQNE